MKIHTTQHVSSSPLNLLGGKDSGRRKSPAANDHTAPWCTKKMLAWGFLRLRYSWILEPPRIHHESFNSIIMNHYRIHLCDHLFKTITSLNFWRQFIAVAQGVRPRKATETLRSYSVTQQATRWGLGPPIESTPGGNPEGLGYFFPCFFSWFLWFFLS